MFVTRAGMPVHSPVRAGLRARVGTGPTPSPWPCPAPSAPRY